MAISDKNNPNADFWLNLAAENIYQSAERRAAAVEALKTIIIWAFGIFSVAGFMLTLFGPVKDYDQLALIFFGIAFFLLTVAYFLASTAQFPSVEKFKLGDVTQIAAAYTNTVKSQATMFTIAASITGLGFFFLAAGILDQFGTIKKNSKSSIAPFSKEVIVKAGVENIGDTVFIPTTVEWGKSQPIRLAYINVKSQNGGKGQQEIFLLNQIFYTDTSGKFYYSFPLSKKDSIKNMIVRITVTNQALKDTTNETVISQRLSILR